MAYPYSGNASARADALRIPGRWDTLEDFLLGFPTVPRSLALEALEEARRLLLAAGLMKLLAMNVSTNGYAFCSPATIAQTPVRQSGGF